MELRRCTTTVLLAPGGMGSAMKGSLKVPGPAVAPHNSLMSLYRRELGERLANI